MLLWLQGKSLQLKQEKMVKDEQKWCDFSHI